MFGVCKHNSRLPGTRAVPGDMNDTLHLDNRLDELPRVREWLTQLPVMQACAPDAINEVWLILDELLTNIISYGYEDTRNREIQVAVGRKGERLLLEIRDDARPFNPLERISSPGASSEIGGWGLQLVRGLSDSLDYARSNEYNVLTIEKEIPLR